MNILFTSHFFSPSVGGIEVISDILTKYFVTQGHNVKVVTGTSASRSFDIDNYNYDILRNPNPITLFRSYLWADVVFQNNIEIRMLWPLLLVRRPLVIGLQTWIRTSSGRRGIVQFIKLLVLKLSDHVIACSNAIRKDSCNSATVIGNPYDHKIFFRQHIEKKKNSIVFLGRLVSDKGVDLLLEACFLLRLSSYSLTIIGSGPELSWLKQLVIDKGMHDNVCFLNAMQGESLAEILNQHEIMVVPSRWLEPFGIVALEGLACGCVVVASNGGGLPDAVGSAGLLFERMNTRDLSNKLKFLLDNPQEQESLRRHSLTHLPHFHSDIISQRYLDILLNVRRSKSKFFD